MSSHEKSPASSTTAAPTGAVMRKTCACDRPLGSTGGCAAYRRKRLGIQAKLRVNQPNDRFEQEADRIAMRVINPAAPTTLSPLQTLTVQRSGAYDGNQGIVETANVWPAGGLPDVVIQNGKIVEK